MNDPDFCMAFLSRVSELLNGAGVGHSFRQYKSTHSPGVESNHIYIEWGYHRNLGIFTEIEWVGDKVTIGTWSANNPDTAYATRSNVAYMVINSSDPDLFQKIVDACEELRDKYGQVVRPR